MVARSKISEEEFSDLSTAAGYSFQCLSPFRTKKLDHLRQYVGANYSDSGAEDKVPIPLMELAVNIYLQRLVASAPKVDVSTDVTKLKEISNRFEIALNNIVEDINLEGSLEDCVSAAMFPGFGIMKTGLNKTKKEYMGYLQDSYQPFALPVSLFNWVHDMSVDRWELCQFMGDRYPVTIEDAKAIFPKDVHSYFSSSRMDGGEEKAHDLTEQSSPQSREFKETILVWDVWLPRENLLLTCLDSGNDQDPFGEILLEQEWFGPETGPYRILGFTKVDDNTVPLSPTSLWKDLHDLANVIFRKLGRQGEDEKNLLLFQKGAEDDIERMQAASDGDVCPVDAPDKSGERKLGGISTNNMAFFLQIKELFSYVGGNLDALGGLGPMSDTLGQDKLLTASASQRVQRMQKKVVKWVTGVLQDIGYYTWYYPNKHDYVIKKIEFIEEIGIRVPFTDDDREGEFLEHNIKMIPNSMQQLSPESKVMALRTLLQELQPYIPMMQEQGVMISFEKYIKTISKLANLPEAVDIMEFASPKMSAEMVMQGGKANNTTRTYERVNRSGATRSGNDKVMSQAFLGVDAQQSEKSKVMQPVG